MSHMQSMIYERERVYLVETDCGTECLPEQVVGNLRCRGTHEEESPRFAELCAAVRDYCAGSRILSIEYAGRQYVGRYSAPGYMDATPWHCSASMQALREELEETYGD